MPTINISGRGAAPTSSAVPFMKPGIGRFNKNFAASLEKARQESEANAKDALYSAVPGTDPAIRRFNANLRRQVERQGAELYSRQIREFRESVAGAKRISGLREKVNKEALSEERAVLQTKQRDFTQNTRAVRQIAALRERTFRQEQTEDRTLLRQSAMGSRRVLALKERFAKQEQTEQKAELDTKVKDFRQSAAAARRIAGMRERERRREEREAALTDPNTYRAENIRRLGARGMRAADEGNWRELHVAQRKIRRNEKKYGSDPNIAKAIGQARARIEAGQRSQSPLRRGMGSVMGMAEDFMENPIVAASIGAVVMAATAPWWVSGNARAAQSMAQPYMGLRYGLANMGRAGNFNSRALEQSLLPKGGGAAQWFADTGMDAKTAAEALQNYGVMPTSANGALNILHRIGNAQYAGSLGGMGFDYYARLAGWGANAGMIGVNGGVAGANGGVGTYGQDAFWRKWQGVTTTAVAMGMDRSEAIGSVQGLLSQAINAGSTTTGGKGIFDFWQRMVGTGVQSMRTGAGEASVLQSALSASDLYGYNGDQAHNMALSMYINRNGGLQAFGSKGKGLEKLLGASTVAQLRANNDPELAALDVAVASGNPLNVYNALSPLIKSNNPVAVNERIAQGAYPGADYYSIARRGTVTMRGPQQPVLDSAYSKVRKNFNPSAENDKTAWNYLRSHGYSAAQAAGIIGNLEKESGLNPGAMNASGHIGIAQWDANRQQDYRVWSGGQNLEDASLTDQLRFLNYEMKHGKEQTAYAQIMGTSTPQDSAAATEHFYERAGDNPADIKQRVAYAQAIYAARKKLDIGVPAGGNDVTTMNRANTTTVDLGLDASRTGYNDIFSAMGGGLGNFATTVSHAASTMDDAAHDLAMSITKLGGILDNFNSGHAAAIPNGGPNRFMPDAPLNPSPILGSPPSAVRLGLGSTPLKR